MIAGGFSTPHRQEAVMVPEHLPHEQGGREVQAGPPAPVKGAHHAAQAREGHLALHLLHARLLALPCLLLRQGSESSGAQPPRTPQLVRPVQHPRVLGQLQALLHGLVVQMHEISPGSWGSGRKAATCEPRCRAGDSHLHWGYMDGVGYGKVSRQLGHFHLHTLSNHSRASDSSRQICACVHSCWSSGDSAGAGIYVTKIVPTHETGVSSTGILMGGVSVSYTPSSFPRLEAYMV
mmetsp:Transcript_35709/g.68496  ORF Transcript_35709/g.68496 Transcript_35709/m.68496 type:complete len:235 (-) Transcript_35709:259-963(-)